MQESDFPAASEIFRVAFGTHIGVPDPTTFATDRDYIGTRWKADPSAALTAEVDGAFAGSNFATGWGSFGFFGPLTVKPEFWNRGVAQSLLGPTMDLFDSWGVTDAGLYTFSNSPKHIALYQKFGFWPRFLTAMMSKPAINCGPVSWLKFSQVGTTDRVAVLAACRELTDSIFAGLNVGREILAVAHQGLGDTVLIWGGDSLEAFAVCHCGAGTEAGAGACYIKFAAARPEVGVETSFQYLVDACQALAVERGLERVEGGVNFGRCSAYRAMLRAGFRTSSFGVAMHKPDSPGYNRPDVYAIDDWR
jgi:GNAT superfamily N-acetyltransferase